MANSHTTYNQTVVEAIVQGLMADRKTLPSWLFYDQTGDDLFRKIMRMPEYYPTRCEYDILQKYREDLREHFAGDGAPFRLIELGAGDGLKTEILLRHFVDRRTEFVYLPVDISANAVETLAGQLHNSMPALRVEPHNKSYDEVLSDLRGDGEKKVILFMGANIGNFTVQQAAEFLRKLARPLKKGDMLLIGFDLKKDPRLIHEAYDDSKGLTAAFNMNLLTRLNREAGAEFDTSQFSHYPCYDPETGANRSFLISMREQEVYVGALERSIHFNRWETIQTEISQKYDVEMIRKLMALTGLNIIEFYYDEDQHFSDVLASSS